jgi:hypothetical protein
VEHFQPCIIGNDNDAIIGIVSDGQQLLRNRGAVTSSVNHRRRFRAEATERLGRRRTAHATHA